MKMTRKEFIKTALTGTAALSPIFISSCTRSNLRFTIEDSDKMLPLTEEERTMLTLASSAPSSHNSQPWTVRIAGPGKWIIGTDRRRWLPVVDPDNREVILSLGAFLENLLQCLKTFGYDARYRIISESREDREIISLSFKKTGESKDIENFRNIVLSRKTIRKGHLKKNISASHLSSLTKGLSVKTDFFLASSETGQFLAKETLNANKSQVKRDNVIKELSNWIRWSYTDIVSNMNGLTPSSMEITGFSRWYVEHFFSSADVLKESFRRRTVSMAKEQVRSTGGWLIIYSKDTTLKSILHCGMNFQRILLRTEKSNIAVHPMSQPLEEKSSLIKISQRSDLKKNIQFICRTGYVKHYGEPCSPRMKLSKIIIKG